VLTLLLVASVLTVIALAAVVMSLALRHGEEQDRTARHTDPHAAYWGTEQPYPARTRAARQTPVHARPKGHRR